MIQSVIVVGHSYTSRLAVARSVAQIGCDVTMVVMTGRMKTDRLDTTKPVDCYSKTVSRFYFCKRNDPEALVSLLLDRCKASDHKPIIIPDSDESAVAIDMAQERLKEHFLFPNIGHKAGAVSYWMDKSVQKELAASLGLNVATASVIDIVDGTFSIPHDMGYPCYSKPLSTFVSGKGGMCRCDNASELSSAIDFVVRKKARTAKVLVEEFKEIETEYAVLGFSDGYDVVIPGVLEILEMSAKNKGIARCGKLMPVTGFEDVVDKFRKLVATIGFVGVFDIDFYRSGNELFFCELNLRFGGSGYVVTKMGVNLPAMLVRYLMGEGTEDMKKNIDCTVSYSNDRMCLDDFKHGHIDYRTFKKCRETDVSFVEDSDDPRPFRAFRKEILKARARNILKLKF